VRTLFRWIVVTLGIAALVRWLRRRGQAPEQAPAAAGEDPADELRRKLAETREDEAGEPHAPGVPADSVEDRRADVHAKGRDALSEMKSSDEG
jgi:hypothetical protein